MALSVKVINKYKEFLQGGDTLIDHCGTQFTLLYMINNKYYLKQDNYIVKRDFYFVKNLRLLKQHSFYISNY